MGLSGSRSVERTVVVTASGTSYVFDEPPDKLAKTGRYNGHRTPERPRAYPDEILRRSTEITAEGPIIPGGRFYFYIGDKAFYASAVTEMERYSPE